MEGRMRRNVKDRIGSLIGLLSILILLISLQTIRKIIVLKREKFVHLTLLKIKLLI